MLAAATVRHHIQRDIMPDTNNLPEIEAEIAAVRENLRDLTEQAAALSGAADEDLAATRIAEQEALLDTLLKQQAALSKSR
jgi:ABC-type transporter Mla subunit MlaD